MPFDSRPSRSLIATASSAVLIALLAANPARADGDMWNNMLGWVGLGHKQHSPDDGSIDYSPRPSLVVPPTMSLPPPRQAAAKPADWPQDPDAQARARADADSRRPAPSSDSGSDQGGDFVADADKTKTDANGESEACTNAPGRPVCFYGPSSLINLTKGLSLGGLFSDHSEDTAKLRVGSEPPRQYLTQPPSGYEMPKVKGEDDSDTDTDTSKYDSVDVGGARHHHHHSETSSAATN